MAKKKVTLTKVEIDNKINRLLVVKQELETLSKEAATLQNELEDQYELPDDKVEIVKETDFEMEKIPVNRGRNSYDAEKLIPFLKAIRGAFKKVVKQVIVRKTEIDIKELDGLVKTGKLPEDILDKCRKNQWTFRTQFRRIEKEASTGENKDVKSKIS